MTKDILEQHTDLLKEVNKLKNRISRIEKQSSITSDVVQNGYKRHAVIRGYDYNRDFKLKKLEMILKERQNMLLNQQLEIEMWINSINSSKIRQIFEYRYIDNMNWTQIQILMGYNHEDTARKKHDKFLKENL